MAYSCALWLDDPGADLDEAQRNKIRYHVREARAAGSPLVLDIGCGWGGVLRSLVDEHGVGQAVGLTLSRNQYEWIADWRHPQIEVRLESWEAHEPQHEYDAIITIGAFEHFARPELSSAEKVEGYRRFFRRCHQWTKPGAFLSLQTFGLENVDARVASALSRYGAGFTPQSVAPYFEEIVLGSLEFFDVRFVRCDGDMYARTMSEWLRRLNAQRREIINSHGPATYKRFRQTFRGAQTLFETGVLTLYRVTLQRRHITGPRFKSPLGAVGLD